MFKGPLLPFALAASSALAFASALSSVHQHRRADCYLTYRLSAFLERPCLRHPAQLLGLSWVPSKASPCRLQWGQNGGVKNRHLNPNLLDQRLPCWRFYDKCLKDVLQIGFNVVEECCNDVVCSMNAKGFFHVENKVGGNLPEPRPMRIS